MSAFEPYVVEHATGFSCQLAGGARALFSSRAQGNLSTVSGERHEHGRAARERLCEALELRWLCASRQVHGADVLRVDSAERRGGEALALDADGHATAASGIGATVLVADCLPVALAGGRRRRDGACRLARARRRRARAGGARAARTRRPRLTGGRRDRPGRRRVLLRGRARGPRGARHATASRRRRRGNIDLRALARERLLAAGVARVLDADACTICDERFFSHRREGARAGRQAGVAWRD